MKTNSRLVISVRRDTVVVVGEGPTAFRITTSCNIMGVWPQQVRLNFEGPRDIRITREKKPDAELEHHMHEWKHRKKKTGQ